MSNLERRRPIALVIGSQGVLGALLVAEFEVRGWCARRGSRRPGSGRDAVVVDLERSDTVSSAVRDVDVVVNTVPDSALVAERAVLETGGTLINVSALPAAYGIELQRLAVNPSGTVVMNAGIAPGLTNLVAADLLDRHPDADEVEMVFTVSTKATSGPSGGDFAHRHLTGARHRTRVVPLPEPYGRRRCLGFAESERGWLAPDVPQQVSTFVCLAEPAAQRAMLAVNALGAIRSVPRSAFRPAPLGLGQVPSSEPVAHWVAVRDHGQRLAARTIEARGDYGAAAAVTVSMADALRAPDRTAAGRLHPGRGDVAGGALPPPGSTADPGDRAERRGSIAAAGPAAHARSSGRAVNRVHRRVLFGVPAVVVAGVVVVVVLAFAGAFDTITTTVVHGTGTRVVRVACSWTPRLDSTSHPTSSPSIRVPTWCSTSSTKATNAMTLRCPVARCAHQCSIRAPRHDSIWARRPTASMLGAPSPSTSCSA